MLKDKAEKLSSIRLKTVVDQFVNRFVGINRLRGSDHCFIFQKYWV